MTIVDDKIILSRLNNNLTLIKKYFPNIIPNKTNELENLIEDTFDLLNSDNQYRFDHMRANLLKIEKNAKYHNKTLYFIEPFLQNLIKDSLHLITMLDFSFNENYEMLEFIDLLNSVKYKLPTKQKVSFIAYCDKIIDLTLQHDFKNIPQNLELLKKAFKKEYPILSEFALFSTDEHTDMSVKLNLPGEYEYDNQYDDEANYIPESYQYNDKNIYLSYDAAYQLEFYKYVLESINKYHKYFTTFNQNDYMIRFLKRIGDPNKCLKKGIDY